MGAFGRELAGAQLDELAAKWLAFSERECGAYAPLYAAVTRRVARERDLLSWLLQAPVHALQPNVLLAAVHERVLDGLEPALCEVYSGRAVVEDPGGLFLEVCRRERQSLFERISTRTTQTNEVGRSAVLALGLAAVAREHALPLALIDAGCSAGLNLLFDRYRLDYGEHGALGPADSSVTLECTIRCESFVLPELPPIASRVGLDRRPVEASEPHEARWLAACVWPEHRERGARLLAALELAATERPRLVAGDLLTGLESLLEETQCGSLATVMTSWALFYLSVAERARFVELLREFSRRRPVVWLSAEGPGVVPFLEQLPGVSEAPTPSLLGSATFEQGHCHTRTLGLVQPHGSWFAPRSEAGFSPRRATRL